MQNVLADTIITASKVKVCTNQPLTMVILSIFYVYQIVYLSAVWPFALSINIHY